MSRRESQNVLHHQQHIANDDLKAVNRGKSEVSRWTLRYSRATKTCVVISVTGVLLLLMTLLKSNTNNYLSETDYKSYFCAAAEVRLSSKSGNN